MVPRKTFSVAAVFTFPFSNLALSQPSHALIKTKEVIAIFHLFSLKLPGIYVSRMFA